MDNLLSGIIGAVIGVVVSGSISILIHKKQIEQFETKLRFESNRQFVRDLIIALQKIYLALQAHKEVSDDDINAVIAFQIMPYQEFEKVRDLLSELKNAIFSYHQGREKRLEDTSKTPHEENEAKDKIYNHINQLLLEIKNVT